MSWNTVWMYLIPPHICCLWQFVWFQDVLDHSSYGSDNIALRSTGRQRTSWSFRGTVMPLVTMAIRKLPWAWTCFSPLLPTLFLLDTQHKWSYRVPKVTGNNTAPFWGATGLFGTYFSKWREKLLKNFCNTTRVRTGICCHSELHLGLLLETLINVAPLVDGTNVLEVRCCVKRGIINLWTALTQYCCWHWNFGRNWGTFAVSKLCSGELVTIIVS